MAKIKIKGISGETSLDDAAATLTFDGLRRKLIADGRMTDQDTFAVDGSVVLRKDEGTLLVVTFSTGSAVIEIRGSRDVEEKILRVTTPAGARSLKLAADTLLRAVRAALGASMGAGEVFTYPDGSPVAVEDEAVLRASHVLRTTGAEKDTVVVLLPVKKSLTVTVSRGARSWSVQLDRSLTLAALRDKLVADRIMGSGDVFLARGGGDVPRSEEGGLSVESAVESDVVKIKNVEW